MDKLKFVHCVGFLYLSSLEIVEFQNALTYCDTHHQIHRYLPVYFFDIALYTNKYYSSRISAEFNKLTHSGHPIYGVGEIFIECKNFK
jgi:hypothetical protein